MDCPPPCGGGVKHLNPRQGITTGGSPPFPLGADLKCETPKSPPGDYNRSSECTAKHCCGHWCETPKSPPGDYNAGLRTHFDTRTGSSSVKHLNPRQGITTPSSSSSTRRGIITQCETPKSPPGDYNSKPSSAALSSESYTCETPKSPPGDYNSCPTVQTPIGSPTNCVKHLNPRQGITTSPFHAHRSLPRERQCVKHLNPRQGITTFPASSEAGRGPPRV